MNRKRTTLYLDSTIIEFLKVNRVNVSEICRKAMSKEADILGYTNDLDTQLKALENRLRTLRKIRTEKTKEDITKDTFLMAFKGYLSTGGKDIAHIRAWLIGPGCDEYRHIIGHPKSLTTEKIEKLVMEAIRYETKN